MIVATIVTSTVVEDAVEVYQDQEVVIVNTEKGKSGIVAEGVGAGVGVGVGVGVEVVAEMIVVVAVVADVDMIMIMKSIITQGVIGIEIGIETEIGIVTGIVIETETETGIDVVEEQEAEEVRDQGQVV